MPATQPETMVVGILDAQDTDALYISANSFLEDAPDPQSWPLPLFSLETLTTLYPASI